jgi:2-oxoglutarate ferredoxin oxidoreductase subunit beta
MLPRLKGLLMVEHNYGQMLREVQRVAGGEKPIDFIGRITAPSSRPRRFWKRLRRRSKMPSDLIYKYMRVDHLPHIWCAGCGNGTLTRDVAVAIDELCNDPDERFRLDREKVVIVSGIGCSSRAAGYLDFNSIHTTHGRAIAFATGIKLANPELTVIVITGDGDCSAIGGNHLIHAARRNVDMTVVVFDNNIYGMTGGQYSPTTPRGDKATTAPYGVIDRPFDIAGLAAGAGASLTARGDTFTPARPRSSSKKASSTRASRL